MTRIMGDATGPSSGSLPGGLDLYAGYVTGDHAVMWTPMDWALVPAAKRVTIDQGFTGSPVPAAVVRDVETGAWGAWNAVNDQPWTAPRPTIYCNRSTLPAVLSVGWRGDLWLAIPGWKPGDPLPAAPGCTIVAVQNNYDNPAYDLSAVLDPTWPLEDPMEIVIPGVPGFWLSVQILSSADGTKQVAVGLGTDGALWQAVRTGGTWAMPVPV